MTVAPDYKVLMGALGPEVLAHRLDERVIDIFVRPWGITVDRRGEGLVETGVVPAPGSIALAIRAMRTHLGGTATDADPRVEGAMPDDGSRFAGRLAGENSYFTIRCHRQVDSRLENYNSEGGRQAGAVQALCALLAERKRGIIVGPTGSGKTFLLRAICAKANEYHPNRHFVIIEDSAELVGFKPAFRTYIPTTSQIAMRECAQEALRHRPDYLVFGEVRGGEALDIQTYSNTGHTTYFTLHAYGAVSGLQQYVSYIRQAAEAVDYQAICDSVDFVATAARRLEPTGEVVDGRPVMRDTFFIKELVSVDEYVGGRWQVSSLLEGVE
jgi:Flp pilus assembly CpaF family ATPase